MHFTILPALDIADGAVARGDGRSPLDVTTSWQAEGAEWLHLVDLDAAVGRGSNAALVADLIERLDLRVQLSAGIEDDASLAWALTTEADRIVLSTGALADLEWCERVIAAHGERLAVALDVQVGSGAGNRLVPRGGDRDVGDLLEVVDALDRAGCARYVITDVHRDGALTGPNVELAHTVARRSPAAIVASGGVASLDDLRAVAAPYADGTTLEGAVVGRALLAGRFTLTQALRSPA